MMEPLFLDLHSDADSHNIPKEHKLFLVEYLTDSELKLPLKTEEVIMIRCANCGFPLNDSEKRDEKLNCFVCRRERRLNSLLITSYILSAILFIVCIFGVIFKKISLDFCLMIGCLEIIFLLFYGRFLEEAVFFKLSKRERLLASLYRFSVSGELQNFDIAYDYLQKFKKFDAETLRSLMQVTSYQATNLPSSWFSDLSKIIEVSPKQILEQLSQSINENQDPKYLSALVNKASIPGISLLTEIFLITNNTFGLKLINNRLEEILFDESSRKEILSELYLNKEKFILSLQKTKSISLINKIETSLSDYTEPKVPSIDVIESSKNIIQRNPLLRYLVRILFYILLAFILGLFYKLLD